MQRENLKFKIENLEFAGSSSARFSKWISIFGFLILFFCGCEGQKRSYPLIATSAEATAILKGYSVGLKPLRATGNCTLSYTDEKGEKYAQSFPVRIWYETSNKFCLYGDVMFDPKGVCFAVTDGKYWTYAKPFGMYVTGQIDTANEDYFSNPTVLVDFLEPIGAECDKIYMAGAEKDFNILMCRDSKLCKTKKIFMERRSRQVKKIEYLNCAGNIILSVEADKYKNVSGAKFSFPRKLIYKYIEKRNLMEIKLDSVKLWRPEAKQLKALFTQPSEAEIKREVK